MPYAQLIQALPDAAILTDPAGVVLGWNDAATELFGWTAVERVGRPLAERFPMAVDAESQEYLQQLAAGGVWKGEFQDYRKDGNRIWIEAHIHPVLNDFGAVTDILCVSRKLSPERAAVLDGKQPDRYATDILDSMSARVAVLGPDGRIREVNRAWEQLAFENTQNGPPPIWTGVDYVSFCRSCSGEMSDGAKQSADGIEEVLQGKRTFFANEYLCDSPQTTKWSVMHVTQLKSSGGAVVAHYDITAHKQTELALAAQSRQTEIALNAAQLGVWRLDLASQRIQWSAEAYKIVGVSSFDGTHAAWTNLVHPDDLPQMQVRFNATLEKRVPFVADFRIIRPSGEIVWLSNLAHVECATSGEVVAVVGTVRDITARKRSEWALAAYNQILELIAAGAALEIILEEIVRLVEKQIPGSLCSVLLFDKGTGRLRTAAGRSLPDQYNREIDGTFIGPKVGSCGTAVFRKSTVTVTDIATDPLWEDFRELALRYGLRSCVSDPIFSSGNVPSYEKGEVIGTFALYNLKPSDLDRLTYSLLSGQRPHRRSDLAERDYNSAQEPELFAGVEAIYLAGVAIERDQAQRAVRESEERFRAVFDSASSAIYIKDLDGRHLFVNEATVKMFGVPQADWVGKTSRELLPPNLADICEHSDRAILAAQGPIEEQLSSRLPNGFEVTVLATHILLRHADGIPYAICGILRDITELIAAQREFERLWLLAPDPLCIVGLEGYFKKVNPAWSRLLGWTEAELLQTPFIEFIHPDDNPGLAAAAEQMPRGETVRGLENRYRCRDGSYRCFSWSAIWIEEGQSVFGIARDVTEEKRLTEQFQQAQKMEAVGQLASGIAHDFNNLLTVINSYAEILLQGMQASDPRWVPLTEVLAAGQRATELTAQLLHLSRKAIIKPKILDINQAIESSARMLRRMIGENLKLETNLASIPNVKIDPGQLEQVLMNLAVNARDAMPDGGRLSITTEMVDLSDGLPNESIGIVPGRYVRVSVADTGTGMLPSVMARIFEPFFTTKGPRKGTGLGLATVYGIVRQTGGTITVESEPGRGSTFRLLFRAEDEAASDVNPPVTSVDAPGTETVLIAEDEEGVRNIARLSLENKGYSVLVAENGTEAVRIMSQAQGPIHLLLTDVVMPDFGGRALAEMLRSQQPGLRVLYMSGYTDDAVIRAGVESSRDWFIQKPFTPHTLNQRVREILDSPAGLPGPEN